MNSSYGTAQFTDISSWRTCICPACGTITRIVHKPGGSFEMYCSECHMMFRIAPLREITWTAEEMESIQSVHSEPDSRTKSVILECIRRDIARERKEIEQRKALKNDVTADMMPAEEEKK